MKHILRYHGCLIHWSPKFGWVAGSIIYKTLREVTRAIDSIVLTKAPKA